MDADVKIDSAAGGALPRSTILSSVRVVMILLLGAFGQTASTKRAAYDCKLAHACLKLCPPVSLRNLIGLYNHSLDEDRILRPVNLHIR